MGKALNNEGRSSAFVALRGHEATEPFATASGSAPLGAESAEVSGPLLACAAWPGCMPSPLSPAVPCSGSLQKAPMRTQCCPVSTDDCFAAGTSMAAGMPRCKV